MTTTRPKSQRMIYVTEASESALLALAARWGLSASATIARAVSEAAQRER